MIEKFYSYCLSTCGNDRLDKIKNVIENTKKNLKKDLNKLKVDDIVDWLTWLNQSNYSLWTKNDYKKVFKRFLKWKYKNSDMWQGNKVKEGFKYTPSLKAFNKQKINKKTLVKKFELEKLIRTAPNLKWQAIISFAYDSGFRTCEIRALKWKDLEFDEAKGICRVTIISPKTKDIRTIPVKDSVIFLKRWKDAYSFPDVKPEDYVFPSQHHRDEKLGKGVISQMFRRLSIKAFGNNRIIFPYLLRHTRIFQVQKKLDTRLSCKFAGHGLRVSELYNLLDDDDVEEGMISKIFNTKELTPKKREQLEKEVAKLRGQLKEYGEELKLIKEGMKSSGSNLL